ncbi:MAG: cation:proton antiporter [Bacteroidales bacterium]
MQDKVTRFNYSQMKQGRANMVYYVGMIVIFAILFSLLIINGSKFLLVDTTPQESAVQISSWSHFLDSINHEMGEPLTLLLIQIIVILLFSRLFGWIFTKIGQPTVIGEIVAGIALGPSLFGYFYPELFELLFAADKLEALDGLSKIGLVLFMFIIGMELDLTILKKKINQTLLISHASILLPFFLGMLLSYFVYESYAAGHTSYLAFSLFIGISMSVTAFPILARILQERNLIKSHLGTLAIASAANDDITAWCLLAAVIAIVKAGSFVSAIYTIALSIVYCLFMFFILRPFLNSLGRIYNRKEVINKTFIAFILAILIISATVTQIIGIHALFGAFVAGVVMAPNLRFRKIMSEKVEDIAIVLLLPLFFVFTGLRTEIGLINNPELWIMCLIFTAVAILGKFGGGALSAKLAGENWHDSLSIGILMNTRGLMELVVLNIGYEMGILPPTIFVMLVIMALVTTFMTSPALNLIDWIYKKRGKRPIVHITQSSYNILLSFGVPESGVRLMTLANRLFGATTPKMHITALHITQGTDVNPMHISDFRHSNFTPMLERSKALNIDISPIHRVTNSVTQEIVETANNEPFDLLLVGAGIKMSKNPIDEPQSKPFVYKIIDKIINKNIEFLTPHELLIDKSELFFEESNVDVAIYIHRNDIIADRILLIIADPKDIFLLEYAERIIANGDIAIQIMLTGEYSGINKSAIKKFASKWNKRVAVIISSHINEASLYGNNLVIFSFDGWNTIKKERHHHLENIPSTLIIKSNRELFE